MPNSLSRFKVNVWAFMEKEQPTWTMAFFRIGLGLICLGKMLALYPSFMEIYGQYGFIQWAISKTSNYSFLPHIGDPSNYLAGHLGITVDEATVALFYLYVALCLMLIAGFLTRLTVIALFLLHLAFINTANAMIYGVDVFTQLSLFYGVFFPLSSYGSADALLGMVTPRRQSRAAGIAIRCIQLQLCLVYGSTAIQKSTGMQWWNGEAIWRTFMMPIFQTYDFSWLAQFPWLAIVTGVIVLVIEGAYPVVMWVRGVRGPWLFLIVLLHLGISFLMGMWFFGFVMVFLSVFAFGHEVLGDLRTRMRSSGSRASTLTQGLHTAEYYEELNPSAG